MNMNRSFYLALAPIVVLAACNRGPLPAIDESLAAEIQGIRAIDNHAHPVRYTAAGEPADRGFDALPVDSMEPQSDPVNLRPSAPAIAEASLALFGRDFKNAKQRLIDQRRGDYPAWVLDQMGVDIMLANRVSMGPSIQSPRFRWVPYADALLFPLDNSALAAQNPDRKAFFALEDQLRGKYLGDAGLQSLPAGFDEYLSRVVTATLEKQKQGGAVAEKFEAAYLRTLGFDRVDRAAAERIYRQFAAKGVPSAAEYKPLQDYLFRHIALECGRLGLAVHIHTMAGSGGYFDVAGANPLLLEPLFDDSELRKTRFVMLHGGWPFIGEITALLTKPNAYLDFSQQDLDRTPAALAATIRGWLEYVPEKVLFASDAYPYFPEMGWEESGWIATRTARQALGIALTGMMRDGEITRARASELARMVLRENAKALYGL
jgi:predicted TIM-barrel fold metal-dependent hydrolase